MLYFLLTVGPQSSIDVQARLLEGNYTYFSHMSESSRNEEMDERPYHLHQMAYMLAINTFAKGDVLVIERLRREHVTLRKGLDIILLKRDDL